MPGTSQAEQANEKLARPFGTFNGKGYEAEHIASILPKHDIFVEAFSGSAAVTFAKKPPTSPHAKEIIAESDEFLFGIWNTIKNLKASDFKKLRGFKSDPDKDYFEKIKTQESAPDGRIKELHWWLYLKHYSLLCSAPDRDAKFFYNKSMKETVEAMPEISSRLENVQIESKTLEELIEAYDSEKTVFYIHAALEDHYIFLESLKQIKGKYILSDENVTVANFSIPDAPRTKPVDRDFIESTRQWNAQFLESNGDNEELTAALAEVIMIARAYPGKSQEELGVDMGKIIEVAKVALSGTNTEAHKDKKKLKKGFKKYTSVQWAEDACKFVTSSKYTDGWETLKERTKFDNWFGGFFAYIQESNSEPEDFMEAQKWFAEHGMRYAVNVCEEIVNIRKEIKESLGESATLEEKTKAEKCVEDKIPKLIDEGEPRERAIAIAFSLCGVARKKK